MWRTNATQRIPKASATIEEPSQQPLADPVDPDVAFFLCTGLLDARDLLPELAAAVQKVWPGEGRAGLSRA